MALQSLSGESATPTVSAAASLTQRLTYPQAAEFLGVKVGTLRVMVHRGAVPFIRLGNRLVVFDSGDLTAHLASRRNLAPTPRGKAA